MSRTDAHTPYWVTARWMPAHTIRCRTRRDPCDLPTILHRRRRRPILSRWRHPGPRCTWDYIDHRTWRQRVPQPPKGFRDHVWTNPQRTRLRAETGAARAEYRATGDVTREVSVDQHHHGAFRLWC